MARSDLREHLIHDINEKIRQGGMTLYVTTDQQKELVRALLLARRLKSMRLTVDLMGDPFLDDGKHQYDLEKVYNIIQKH